MSDPVPPTRERIAQRRRTRRAIVDAATALLGRGGTPSINEIAEAAEVSRRTVYLHFPTLDQLLIDAIAGSMSTDVDDALAASRCDDPRARLRTLVEALTATTAATMPLGRKLIKLTVDLPDGGGKGRRGHRRVGWIETAIAPLRAEIGGAAFERLVSGLAVILGWEAFVVLADVRGLEQHAASAVVMDAAMAIYDGATQVRIHDHPAKERT